jgi:hypothetical protein
MKGLLARRPSPAMVVALIALICALTGTAWAALGKNSVGTKQLKKNAVTTAKIKKDAVTGAKVKESTLATVPSASVANSLSPLEATHIVGAPGEPGFEGGSSNLSFPGVQLNPVGFYKDHEGIVHLQGIAQVGKGASITPIFTLPPGFRPASGHVVIFEQTFEDAAVIGGSSTFLEGIDLSGKVAGAEEEFANLDGIAFRAES